MFAENGLIFIFDISCAWRDALGMPVKWGWGWKKWVLANVGIEPKTFALLARRSNQLS